MPDPTPRIVAVADQFRAELLAEERAAASRMVRAYGGVWGRLSPRLDAITQAIEAKRAAGEEVHPDWLRRQERYTELLRQTAAELVRFASFADLTIQDSQQRAVNAALAQAQELVGQGLPPGLGFRDLAQIGIEWNRLPAEALTDLVGTLGNGSPLRTLLDAIPGGVTARVSDALINGVAQGWGPRKAADVVRSETGMGLSRALRIARTEVLRSYRTATRRQYQANPDLVRGWRRHAAKNARTCLACLVLDGKSYRIDEDMDDHVMGRCALVPETISHADLGLPVTSPPLDWERGQQWFERQPEVVQAEMMGPELFDAWQSGRVTLDRIPKLIKDKDWGNAWVVNSLKDLLGKQDQEAA